MSTEFITKAVISHLFYAFVQVYIDENEAEPIITKIIWKTPWHDGTEAVPRAKTTITNKADAHDGTEKGAYLSEYWLTKLKTELSARKYSIQTRQIYVYYNRELCAFCRKAPTNTGIEDIKNFLADLNDHRRQSALSMNLAKQEIRGWLFPGQPKEEHLARRSAQKYLSRRWRKRVFKRTFRYMVCVIHSLPTFWRVVRTCGTFKSCLVTRPSAPPSATPT